MQSTTRTIAKAVARLDATISSKRGADLPSVTERQRLRVEAGLSQRDLANVIGVGKRTIYVWEHDEHLPSNGHSQVYGAVLQRLAEVQK